MEKGMDKRTDTLQTDKVFTRKEYIEREAVLAMKKPFPTSKDSITLYQQYFISPTAVEKIPAADVVPVRHGRWRKAIGTSGVLRMACTNCGFMRFPENDSREPMFNFCPNCGALMDKDGDEDV